MTNSSHWVYAGTGFSDGDVVPGIVGYEADTLMPNYPPPNSANQTLLSQSPLQKLIRRDEFRELLDLPGAQRRVGLRRGHDVLELGARRRPGPCSQFLVDARIQQTTANILNAFLNGAAPPTITSFTPTSGPVGTSVTISGTNFTGATAVTFNGTAASFTVTSERRFRRRCRRGQRRGR